ncbi:hypothetical protein DOTSEDRAFT_28029 [Dothistroma septosporum NZE10]|uniref:CENP-V/GFA domain-containing protein n=1 Tax=Dothistroma septosporum (strain NZE10 / CBS 128990) TaxID=675120 RepID=N1PDD7_DOTSN|nr:hypothetical protein DOTSEDRAFT_28029 [Dothistroma septosporum NZE10]
MSTQIHGGCNCGQHKFTIPSPTEMNLCHCIDCCKWAGAFHSAHLMMSTSVIKSEGPTPKTYTVKADSGNTMERAWCNNCGAGIWIRQIEEEGKEPERTNLKAGLFERQEVCGPTMENWMKNMMPWETPAKGTKRQAVDGN